MGNYPAPPGPRMAYDRDGSQAAYINEVGTVTQYTAAQMKTLNDESSSNLESGTPAAEKAYSMLAVVFPEPRNLAGYFFGVIGYLDSMPSSGPPPATGYGDFHVVSAQVSTDSTTGVDGTWSDLTPFGFSADSAVSPAYRQQIQAVSFAGVKAFRMRMWVGNSAAFGRKYFRALHLYGAPAATSDRLELWHPTLDEPLSNYASWFDWGERPRDSTATKTFRVKNLSSALTANTITVGMDALTDATPSYAAMHKFSYGATVDAATITIPSLPPTAMSDVITIKQILDPASVIGVWAQRITATAGAWV